MALSADFPESFLMITFFHRPTTASKKQFPSKKKPNMPCCCKKKKSAEGNIHWNSVCCSVMLVQILGISSWVQVHLEFDTCLKVLTRKHILFNIFHSRYSLLFQLLVSRNVTPLLSASGGPTLWPMNGTRSRPSARSAQLFRSWPCSSFLKYIFQQQIQSVVSAFVI